MNEAGALSSDSARGSACGAGVDRAAPCAAFERATRQNRVEFARYRLASECSSVVPMAPISESLFPEPGGTLADRARAVRI
jgi:hypothetical protein